MKNKELIVMDIQNDITKNYKDIIDNVNEAIDWAIAQNMTVIYIKHNDMSEDANCFIPGSKGAELVPELKVVSDISFEKTQSNVMTSNRFVNYITQNGYNEFFFTGADALCCVKSSVCDMVQKGYTVHVFKDCITSYDNTKIDEVVNYYESQGCIIEKHVVC